MRGRPAKATRDTGRRIDMGVTSCLCSILPLHGVVYHHGGQKRLYENRA